MAMADVILGLLPALGECSVAGDWSAAHEVFDEVRHVTYHHGRGRILVADGLTLIHGPRLHRWAAQVVIGFDRDLVTCHVLRVLHVTGIIPAVIASRRSGMKMIVEVASEEIHAPREPWWLIRFYWWLMLKTAHGIIATTEGVERRIRHDGYQGHTVVIPAFAPVGNAPLAPQTSPRMRREKFTEWVALWG